MSRTSPNPAPDTRRRNPNPWAAVSRALDTGWPGDFDARAEAGYRDILGDAFAPEIVLAAVGNLARSGRDFYPRPSASDVADECNRIAHPQLAEVSWTEFWAAYEAAGKNRSFPRTDTVSGKAAWMGTTIAAEIGPVAGAFAAAIYDRVRHEQLGDPTVAGIILARYRAEWDEFQRDMRPRGLHGGRIPTPGDMLKRSGRDPRVLSSAAESVAQISVGEQLRALQGPRR